MNFFADKLTRLSAGRLAFARVFPLPVPAFLFPAFSFSCGAFLAESSQRHEIAAYREEPVSVLRAGIAGVSPNLIGRCAIQAFTRCGGTVPGSRDSARICRYAPGTGILWRIAPRAGVLGLTN